MKRNIIAQNKMMVKYTIIWRHSLSLENLIWKFIKYVYFTNSRLIRNGQIIKCYSIRENQISFEIKCNIM